MLKKIKILLFLFISFQISAQELDCNVEVNADKIPGSNKQIFVTMQNAIKEFVNQTRWTNQNFKPQEKINCSITITILEQTGTNDFKGSIQVQATRPVYNTNYLTPIFNMKDRNFAFSYTEYEPLEYNENSFQSNLISVLSFYVYTVLGLDADTFALNGGTPYFKKAENVVNQAQQSEYKGWNLKDGNNTRFKLIDDLLAPQFTGFRNAFYTYHLKGLDTMEDDKKKAKDIISNVIKSLIKVNNVRRNSFIMRVFMDAKAEELVNIYKGGPNVDVASVRENLIKLSPINLPKWNKIK